MLHSEPTSVAKVGDVCVPHGGQGVQSVGEHARQDGPAQQHRQEKVLLLDMSDIVKNVHHNIVHGQKMQQKGNAAHTCNT